MMWSIDFMKREGVDCLIKNTRNLLDRIQLKYDEYGITDKPFVVIKAGQGTYSKGIMVAYSTNDVKSLDRKPRNNMSSIKKGSDSSAIIYRKESLLEKPGVTTDIPLNPACLFPPWQSLKPATPQTKNSRKTPVQIVSIHMALQVGWPCSPLLTQ